MSDRPRRASPGPDGSRRVIVNPRSGERITVLTSARETRGELFAFELELRPGGRIPSAHHHPEQVERFTVLEGRAIFRLGTRQVVAGAGDAVTVRPGLVHRLRNGGNTVTRLHVEVRPALRMEEMLATAADLFGGRRRLRSAVDLAVFIRDFGREVRAPFAGGALRAATAPLARRTGRRRHTPKAAEAAR